MMEEAATEDRHQKRQNATVDAHVLHSSTFAERFLTKREQFALEAMKVILVDKDNNPPRDTIAAYAYLMADAMVKAGSNLSV